LNLFPFQIPWLLCGSAIKTADFVDNFVLAKPFIPDLNASALVLSPAPVDLFVF
jgi:hypothetical protein